MPSEVLQHSGKLAHVLTGILLVFHISLMDKLIHSISKGYGVAMDHCSAKEAKGQLEIAMWEVWIH